ncbi:MAG: class I SAM-dependent methyltransferase [Acidimicrobiales bacterium]
MSIHDVAARAYASVSDVYEQGRPSYPAEAVATLVRELALGPASTVVDVAAGTGKLTRLLLPSGARIVAIEPVAAMRSALVAAVAGVEVVAATAEALPLAPGSADAITVAQAFHWFRAGDALVEMARALRPGGGLALVWNERDESTPWVAELNQLMRWREQPTPQYGDGVDWAEAVAEAGAFTPLQRRRFANPQELSVEDLVARVRSTSYIATWSVVDQDALDDQVRDLVGELGERFVLPHVTDVFWCHRR